MFGGLGSNAFAYLPSDFAVGVWDTIQDFDTTVGGDYDQIRFYDMNAGDLTMQTIGGHTYISSAALAGGGVLNGGGLIVLNTTTAELQNHMLLL